MIDEGAAEAVSVDWTVVVVVPVGDIETVALVGAVAVIVAPTTLIPEEKM